MVLASRDQLWALPWRATTTFELKRTRRPIRINRETGTSDDRGGWLGVRIVLDCVFIYLIKLNRGLTKDLSTELLALTDDNKKSVMGARVKYLIGYAKEESSLPPLQGTSFLGWQMMSILKCG